MAKLNSKMVLTVGHSTRPIEQFLRLLQANAVTCLVDVRTVPRSRHNPQFNRESLQESLGACGIGYQHLAELGGLVAVLGFLRAQAVAERIVAPELAAVKLPDGVGFEVGAATLLTYLTTMHALIDRARLRPGETLLVLGAAGGVGLAAVQLGKLLGARVIAAASSPEKVAFCQQQGADLGICYGSEDLKERTKALTQGQGADVIYDPIGGPFAEPALRAIAWEGRYLVVGFAAGEIPKIPLNLTLLKGCQIVGVFWGQFAAREPQRNREHAARVLEWVEQGKLAPHLDAVLPFAQAPEALRRMERREVRGKLVLVP